MCARFAWWNCRNEIWNDIKHYYKNKHNIFCCCIYIDQTHTRCTLASDSLSGLSLFLFLISYITYISSNIFILASAMTFRRTALWIAYDASEHNLPNEHKAKYTISKLYPQISIIRHFQSELNWMALTIWLSAFEIKPSRSVGKWLIERQRDKTSH